MEDPQPRPRNQADRTDRLIGYSAMFISLLALVVSIVQLRQNDVAQRASVWPALSINVNTSNNEFEMILQNAGTGPAILKSYTYVYQEKPLVSMRSLLSVIKCTGTNTTSEASYSINTVVPAGASWKIFSLKSDTSSCPTAIRHEVVLIKTVYCSVYDDCWELTDTIGGHTPRLRRVNMPE